MLLSRRAAGGTEEGSGSRRRNSLLGLDAHACVSYVGS